MKPNVGMVYPVAAKVDAYTPGSAITYGTGMVISEARRATLSWERADGSFYGDDVLLDSDNSVLGYTIDFEPTGLSTAARAYLLGETAENSAYAVTDEAAPDVGFGYVRVMRDNSGVSGAVKTTYESWWFCRLKFSVNSEETRTKERSIDWRTPTLTGTGYGVSLDNTGVLKFAEHQDFETEAAAKAWLKGKAGIQ